MADPLSALLSRFGGGRVARAALEEVRGRRALVFPSPRSRPSVTPRPAPPAGAGAGGRRAGARARPARSLGDAAQPGGGARGAGVQPGLCAELGPFCGGRRRPRPRVVLRGQRPRLAGAGPPQRRRAAEQRARGRQRRRGRRRATAGGAGGAAPAASEPRRQRAARERRSRSRGGTAALRRTEPGRLRQRGAEPAPPRLPAAGRAAPPRAAAVATAVWPRGPPLAAGGSDIGALIRGGRRRLLPCRAGSGGRGGWVLGPER